MEFIMPPRKKTDDVVNQIKEVANSPVRKDDERVEFLNSGSTLLNLAASQKGKDGGWARGRVINLVGDSSSGKSALALEVCAQSLYNIKNIESKIYPKPQKVSIVYNNVEGVMDFPISQMFGEKFNNEIEWIQTPTCEGFGKDYQQRVRNLKSGEFLLYILDSIDALTTEASSERMDQLLTDKKVGGSYGLEKPKFFSSEFFNHLCGIMKGKDSTLVCISQVRQNIGIMFGEKLTRTGGKALDFYAHQVCWLATIEKMKKTFRNQDRIYGVKIRARFKKNKTAIPYRECDFSIIFNFGIDDVNSMLDFCFGPKSKEMTWNDQEMKRGDLVELIDNSKEDYLLLQELTEKIWHEIEEGIKPRRKNRFID
jgi:recombination protein RecA